ncbi:MAG TPA: TssQ family T6SS-associated lipoprotein [Burkholderiaceae bacterium]|nr:TssQ family T6SS-associated lipoprotein [Burkholderiaceae bacterium]
MNSHQRKVSLMHLVRRLLPAAVATCLGACATPEPTTVSVAELLQHKAEHSLVVGLRDYDDGAFEAAERALHAAISEGLRDPRDTAVAYKYLAFIACAFNRLGECESDFRSAFTADPNFRLSAAEVGHPIWGPVYQKVAASANAQQKPN